VLDLHSRGLNDLKGAVPVPAPGLEHTAPTYVVGFPGSLSHGHCGPALFKPNQSFPHLPYSETPADSKAALRTQALARRGLVTAGEAKAFARRLAEIGAGLAAGHRASIVSGFWPIKNEPSTLLLMEALSKTGIVTALPVTPARGLPLIFRSWQPGDPLAEAKMKIMEPLPEASEVLPDLLFVPLAAFDRHGHRLGYGAGFYDRSLAKLRALKKVTAIGVAFEVQELQDLPQEPHDEPLDYVLTERSLIRCNRI